VYRRNYDAAQEAVGLGGSPGVALRSRGGHGSDSHLSEPAPAYDQLIPTQPPPPSADTACAYEGLAVISFHVTAAF